MSGAQGRAYDVKAMLRSRRVLLGLGVTLVFLLLFVRQLQSLKDVGDALARADYRWLLAGIPVYFLGVWFRTERWQVLLRPVRSLATHALFPYMVIGYMANDLMPARTGEVVRAYLTGRRFDIAKSSVLGTVAVERVSDGLTLVAFMFIAALALPLTGWITSLAALMAVGFLAALALLLVLVSPRGRSLGIWQAIGNRLPARLSDRIAGVAGGFIHGMTALLTPRWLGLIGGHAVLAWVFEAGVFYITGLALGLDAPIAAYVLAMATANLATALPSSQAGIGPFEFFASETLVLYGTPPAQAVAFALLVHLVLILPVVLAGFVYLARENLSLAGLLQRASGTAPQPEVR